MATNTDSLERLIDAGYPHGFVTDIDTDSVPAGLNEAIIELISAKKCEPDFMLEWRLKAYRHWLTQAAEEPRWAHVSFPPIDYQKIVYYAAPRSSNGKPKSLEDVDPQLLATYEKLGIPLHERAALAGRAGPERADRGLHAAGGGHRGGDARDIWDGERGEKLLALDEELWVGFDFKGLK